MKRMLGGLLLLALAAPAAGETPRIRLPEGFRLSVFAENLPGVRFMALSPTGELTVSRPKAGQILLLPDRNGDGRADRTIVFARKLDRPHGLAWKGGALYVAETGAILKLEDRNGDGVSEKQETLTRDLPAGGGHWTRTLVFGPDGGMYVSVGSSCNACREKDPRRATVLRFSPDGKRLTIFARGLRNSVGLAFHPITKELWGTDNGRDYLGDDLPPDELNAIKQGGDYGWPGCYGDKRVDPSFGTRASCEKTLSPALSFPAHVAPLGIAFYTGKKFPSEYQNDAFVAFHGSWNKSKPDGYKVIRVRFRQGRPTGWKDFATGFLRNGEAWGRPVDVLVARDGALLVSDDKGGRIFRISYR
ncbi:MAG: PQQ-dependent sugar dehydrogenase [Bacteroidota bacterium]